MINESVKTGSLTPEIFSDYTAIGNLLILGVKDPFSAGECPEECDFISIDNN